MMSRGNYQGGKQGLHGEVGGEQRLRIVKSVNNF
jgi:hypothetical protein